MEKVAILPMARSLDFQVLFALAGLLVPPPRLVPAQALASPCTHAHAAQALPPLEARAPRPTAAVDALPAQEPGAARKHERYPPERHASVVRFFTLEGDVKPDVLRKAVSELSTKAVESRIVGDPSVSSTRPGKHFIALQTPASASLQDVEKALRKSNGRVQALEWSLFRGAKQGPAPILGYSGRDCVIGMSSDMRWFEFAGDVSSFFYVPGKLRAAKLADLYRKLYQPFGGGELGQVARETIQWSLKAPVDEAAARRAEKAMAKLEGVREAKIDAATGGLRLIVELDGLKHSAPLLPDLDASGADGGVKADQGASDSPRYDTNPLLDVLAKEQLALAPRKG